MKRGAKNSSERGRREKEERVLVLFCSVCQGPVHPSLDFFSQKWMVQHFCYGMMTCNWFGRKKKEERERKRMERIWKMLSDAKMKTNAFLVNISFFTHSFSSSSSSSPSCNSHFWERKVLERDSVKSSFIRFLWKNMKINVLFHSLYLISVPCPLFCRSFVSIHSFLLSISHFFWHWSILSSPSPSFPVLNFPPNSFFPSLSGKEYFIRMKRAWMAGENKGGWQQQKKELWGEKERKMANWAVCTNWTISHFTLFIPFQKWCVSVTKPLCDPSQVLFLKIVLERGHQLESGDVRTV